MSDWEPPAPEPPIRRVHPLPALCWMWPVGGSFLLMIGGLIVQFCMDPPPMAVADFPRSHPRWKELMIIGGAGLTIGAAYGWFWYRFAVKQILTRKMWHVGTGLILTGATFFLLTGWLLTGVVFLLTLAFWAQGNTRKHFDWS